MPNGAVVALQTVYELGLDWYRSRPELDWERPDAATIFSRHGLTGPFWSLESSAET